MCFQNILGAGGSSLFPKTPIHSEKCGHLPFGVVPACWPRKVSLPPPTGLLFKPPRERGGGGEVDPAGPIPLGPPGGGGCRLSTDATADISAEAKSPGPSGAGRGSTRSPRGSPRYARGPRSDGILGRGKRGE